MPTRHALPIIVQCEVERAVVQAEDARLAASFEAVSSAKYANTWAWPLLSSSVLKLTVSRHLIHRALAQARPSVRAPWAKLAADESIRDSELHHHRPPVQS